jgi:hypothetical protein
MDAKARAPIAVGRLNGIIHKFGQRTAGIIFWKFNRQVCSIDHCRQYATSTGQTNQSFGSRTKTSKSLTCVDTFIEIPFADIS